MSSLPDLSEPDVAKYSLLLGFSFSLTPDGSPGSYNEQIARGLRADLQKVVKGGVSEPWIGVQWEVYDAVVGHDDADGVTLAKYIPNDHIAAPPKFRLDDFGHPDTLVKTLVSGRTSPLRELSEQLECFGCDLSKSDLDAAELVSCLNNLLDDRDGFVRYVETVKLHDLDRKLALLAERRTLPVSAAYPSGLRQFQANRINRLIIESIYPDEAVLKRGQYLSTQGVLDLLLSQLKQDKPDIRHIFIYGHPVHSQRCRLQTIKSLRAHGWKISASDVHDVNGGQNWKWDMETAQEWCRSQDNWNEYEHLVTKVLAGST